MIHMDVEGQARMNTTHKIHMMEILGSTPETNGSRTVNMYDHQWKYKENYRTVKLDTAQGGILYYQSQWIFMGII